MVLYSGFTQHSRAYDVDINEVDWAHQRAIDMRMSSDMNDCIYCRRDFVEYLLVSNASFHEFESDFFLQRSQVHLNARVS